MASGFLGKAKDEFSSPRGFLHMIQTDETEAMAVNKANGELLTSNVDLDPTPPESRVWGSWSYLLFEFSVAFSPVTYNVGASLINIGLPYYAIIICAFIASGICSIVIYLNSRGAAIYHVGFPVYVRISTGIKGSLFFIFIRGVVAVLYMATQTLYAGYLMANMLRCIFGHKWTDIPNHLPANAGTTSQGLIAFFIFWCIQLPFAWIHPSKAVPIFAAKSVVVPVALIATMIWALAAAGGPHWENFQKAQITDSSLRAWAWLRAINAVISGTLPPLINIPDLARYAKRPSSVHPMVIGLFISKPLCIILGIVTTAAGNQLFDKPFWNQWDFYNAILDHHWNAGSRTAVFFLALTQCYATMCTNITSNSIPVGCDLTGLFPRYFTIRRGQILVSILAFACVPWKLVYSAASFLTFLGSYVCMITPIAACEIIDYWVLRKGNIHVHSLYKASSVSPYYYWHGVNLRAYAAWVSGVVIAISGIAGLLNPGSVPQTAVNLYNNSFILSASASSVVFYILSKIWPPPIYPAGYEEMPKTFEYLRPSEGYFEDEEVIGVSSIHGRAVLEVEESGDNVVASNSSVEKKLKAERSE